MSYVFCMLPVTTWSEGRHDNNISVPCSSVTCVHATAAALTPSTASTFPFKTHSLSDVPLHQWGTRRKESPTITPVDRSKVSGIQGGDQEVFVFVILKFGVFWDVTSNKRRRAELRGTKNQRQKSWGDTQPARRSGVAPLPETPPTESAKESASA